MPLDNPVYTRYTRCMPKKIFNLTDEEVRAINVMRIEKPGAPILDAVDIVREALRVLWSKEHPYMSYPDAEGNIEPLGSVE